MILQQLFESSPGGSDNYAENLAQTIFDKRQDISSEEEVLNQAYHIVANDMGQKTARYKFSYDEDFPSDVVSNYFHLQKQGVTEDTPRVDSLVTDALKIMRGAELNDAVQALKTVLGDREYDSRRGFYNFYVRQLIDMYGKKGVAEGSEDRSRFIRHNIWTVMDSDEEVMQHPVEGNPFFSAKKLIRQLDDEGYEFTHVISPEGKITYSPQHDPRHLKNFPDDQVDEGEKDTSWMNKQSQDFYNKNPNFKRDDRETKSLGNNRLATRVGPTGGVAKVKKKPMTPFESAGRVDSAVSQAITRRILNQRQDLLKYGPQAVMDAIDEVADWVGDAEEIGSSDVSAWINQVARILQTQNGEGVAESSDDTVGFEIDSENAYNKVMAKFGSVIDWHGDAMVAPRKYWGDIQELAHSAGGEATEAGDEHVAEGRHGYDDHGYSLAPGHDEGEPVYSRSHDRRPASRAYNLVHAGTGKQLMNKEKTAPAEFGNEQHAQAVASKLKYGTWIPKAV